MKKVIISVLLISTICSAKGQAKKVYERKKVIHGCGVVKPIDSVLLVDCTEPAQEYKKLVLDMLHTKGQSTPIVIANSNSPLISFAISGLLEDGKPCIILKESDFGGYSYFSKRALLSHEMGHIANYDVAVSSPLDTSKELKADFYAGVWCAREKFPQIDSMLLPFSDLDSDDVHPPFKRRKAELEKGWNEGNLPEGSLVNSLYQIAQSSIFTWSRDTIAKLDTSNVYGNYVDLLTVISPSIVKHTFSPDRLLDKVDLDIVSNNPLISNDLLLSKIRAVSYVFDQTTFKKPYVYLDSRYRENNFEYNLKVWGNFPITVIVTYVDDSKSTFVKNFQLPDTTDFHEHGNNDSRN